MKAIAMQIVVFFAFSIACVGCTTPGKLIQSATGIVISKDYDPCIGAGLTKCYPPGFGWVPAWHFDRAPIRSGEVPEEVIFQWYMYAGHARGFPNIWEYVRRPVNYDGRKSEIYEKLTKKKHIALASPTLQVFSDYRKKKTESTWFELKSALKDLNLGSALEGKLETEFRKEIFGSTAISKAGSLKIRHITFQTSGGQILASHFEELLCGNLEAIAKDYALISDITGWAVEEIKMDQNIEVRNIYKQTFKAAIDAVLDLNKIASIASRQEHWPAYAERNASQIGALYPTTQHADLTEPERQAAARQIIAARVDLGQLSSALGLSIETDIDETLSMDAALNAPDGFFIPYLVRSKKLTGAERRSFMQWVNKPKRIATAKECEYYSEAFDR